MNISNISRPSRMGLHYFPDSLHYRDSDLNTWVPRLRSLGCSWLTLIAPEERAIPESFIVGLLDAGIEPVLHFPLSLMRPVSAYSVNLLFETYARWGVRFAALFDRPNISTAWTPSTWVQHELVERFLDAFLPIAEGARQSGLTPLFPPLQPGGDFWDLAFLRAALRGIKRRGYDGLLDNLALGAYAWSGNRPLDWGAGGPERWPRTRPYQSLPGTQDQRGFHIFDWYLTTAQAEIGHALPIILLRAGSLLGDQTDSSLPAVDAGAHAQRNLALAQQMLKTKVDQDSPQAGRLPAELLACNFWVLAADSDSQAAPHAWFRPDGSPQPVVEALQQWLASYTPAAEDPAQKNGKKSIPPEALPAAELPLSNASLHPIAHYLLMPLYEWGVSDWQMESVRPFVRKYRPTLGFSVEEARMARRVTVAGGALAFSEEVVARLRQSGSVVERLTPDGTLIAT